MTIDGWRLTDGEELHSQYPPTFRIPPLELRSILQPGDFAKLLFVIAVDGEKEPVAERMWVIVRERLAVGYLGILDNKPSCLPEDANLSRGTELPFEPRHVIDVKKKDQESIKLSAKSQFGHGAREFAYEDYNARALL